MAKTVLVLGATGKFGKNAAEAFERAGWLVRRFDRARDTLARATQGADVIVNAWHAPYSKWETEALAMQVPVRKAALDNDATVIIPGNVYVFGEQTPAPWSPTSDHNAQNPLGRIRIALEKSYRDAGVRTIVLRSGDFLDTHASGNWFDKIMVPSLKKGVLTYPGNPDLDHAWGYLPDLARACVALSDKRDELEPFCDVTFPGYTLSGKQLAQALAAARGQEVLVKKMAWWPLRLAYPFLADIRHLFEMRYLWNTPHKLDGTKFDELLPGFRTTPVKEALRQAAEFVPVPAVKPPHLSETAA